MAHAVFVSAEVAIGIRLRLTAPCSKEPIPLFRHRRNKCGGALPKAELEEGHAIQEAMGIDILALDQALTRLYAIDARPARIVELRYFGGLSVEETAEALEISPATVKREWTMAKAWLLVSGFLSYGEFST
jgi:hypothetical protein